VHVWQMVSTEHRCFTQHKIACTVSLSCCFDAIFSVLSSKMYGSLVALVFTTILVHENAIVGTKAVLLGH